MSLEDRLRSRTHEEPRDSPTMSRKPFVLQQGCRLMHPVGVPPFWCRREPRGQELLPNNPWVGPERRAGRASPTALESGLDEQWSVEIPIP